MRKALITAVAAITLVVGFTLAFGTTHARAATNTLTVTTTADDAGAVACVVASGSGTCVTLRDAITQANSDTGDTINLPAGTITLTDCSDPATAIALQPAASMTIVGKGSTMTTIAGGTCPGIGGTAWNDPLIFDCQNAGALELDSVTLTGGDASQNGSTGVSDGGGVNVSDGECNSVNLSMTDVNFTTNTALDGGGGLAFAGGGNVSLKQVTFSGNHADNCAGGGAYIASSGLTTLQNMYVHNNVQTGGECSLRGGGGLWVAPTGTTDTATNMLITNNTATGDPGGGVYQHDESPSKMSWSNITLSGNSATTRSGLGGGFYVNTGTEADLTNVTATGNTAGFAGGAFATEGGSATLHLTFATINGNSSGNRAGGALFQNSDSGGRITVGASILYQNLTTGGECDVVPPKVISAGYNRSDDASCGFTQSTDQQSSSFNPLLSSLADNVVSTVVPPSVGANADNHLLSTEALQAGSPAIDQLPDPAPCVPSTTFDERGVARPQGTACDLGAFEFIPAVATPTPTAAPLAVPVTGSAAGTGDHLVAYAFAALGGAFLLLAVVGRLARRRDLP